MSKKNNQHTNLSYVLTQKLEKHMQLLLPEQPNEQKFAARSKPIPSATPAEAAGTENIGKPTAPPTPEHLKFTYNNNISNSEEEASIKKATCVTTAPA